MKPTRLDALGRCFDEAQPENAWFLLGWVNHASNGFASATPLDALLQCLDGAPDRFEPIECATHLASNLVGFIENESDIVC